LNLALAITKKYNRRRRYYNE